MTGNLPDLYVASYDGTDWLATLVDYPDGMVAVLHHEIGGVAARTPMRVPVTGLARPPYPLIGEDPGHPATVATVAKVLRTETAYAQESCDRIAKRILTALRADEAELTPAHRLARLIGTFHLDAREDEKRHLSIAEWLTEQGVTAPAPPVNPFGEKPGPEAEPLADVPPDDAHYVPPTPADWSDCAEREPNAFLRGHRLGHRIGWVKAGHHVYNEGFADGVAAEKQTAANVAANHCDPHLPAEWDMAITVRHPSPEARPFKIAMSDRATPDAWMDDLPPVVRAVMGARFRAYADLLDPTSPVPARPATPTTKDNTR